MDLENRVLHWNKLAMDHLRFNNFSEAHGLLKQAEQAILKSSSPSKHGHLLAITNNNQGWFYKKQGKYILSIRFLQAAVN